MNDKNMDEQWMTLRISLPYEMVDAVTNFCHEHGSGGVILDDDQSDRDEDAGIENRNHDRLWPLVHRHGCCRNCCERASDFPSRASLLILKGTVDGV